MKKKIIYTTYLLITVFFLLEVALRFYYPFQRKIIGEKIQLTANITYRLKNSFNNRLDSIIINKRNSIGFRGDDPPENINKKLSILAVGGSTTACTFLSEGKTWVDDLDVMLREKFSNLWINNAGIDGASTFGHLKFLEYYISPLSFKPKIMLFLIGANDIDRDDLATIDSSSQSEVLLKIGKWINTHSEVLNLLHDVKLSIHPNNIFAAKENWNFTNFQSIYFDSTFIHESLYRQAPILKNFQLRLYGLLAWCKKYNIHPVFITQPLVFGDGTVEGGNPKIDFHIISNGYNGQLLWLKLKLYNDVTLKTAAQYQIPSIDLASLLPKDTTYYYDLIHYTNAGAQKVAEIINDKLEPILKKEFPSYLKK